MSESSETAQQPVSGSGAENFIPLWEPGSRIFAPISLSLLERKRSSGREYYVYSDEETFKVVQAETAIKAIEASEIQAPLKVLHAHCRMPHSIAGLDLQFSKVVTISLDDIGIATLPSQATTATPQQPASRVPETPAIEELPAPEAHAEGAGPAA